MFDFDENHHHHDVAIVVVFGSKWTLISSYEASSFPLLSSGSGASQKGMRGKNNCSIADCSRRGTENSNGNNCLLTQQRLIADSLLCE